MVRSILLSLGILGGVLAGTAHAGPLIGDADGSGVVDTRDALLILQADVGLVSVSAILVDNADVNADGRINVIDAALILQYDAGIIEVFP